MGITYSYEQIARMVDLSTLKPNLTIEQLEEGIDTALAYGVASVCTLPYYLKRTAERLAGSGIEPCTVIGFPHGAHATDAKVAEARIALADGGTELDMVCNVSQVRSGQWEYVRRDIQAVIAVAHDAGAKVKVIFENCYLTDAEKIALCGICSELQADWVKTSTGFGTSGAEDHDLELMRAHCPESVQVKAAGGVRTLDRALRVRELGCTRFGATATREILDEHRRRLGLEPIVP